MSKQLQQFGTHQSKYERPNQNWTCGHYHEGKECANGPDKKGKCQASFECLPYKNGDRWNCSRPPQRGGACEDGPLPDGTCCSVVEKCQPIPSVRYQRSRVVYMVFAFTIGVTLMVLFGNKQLQWISPGPVSSVHASFLQDCAKCHNAVFDNTVNWLTMGTDLGEPNSDSHKCLECHQMGEFSFQTHNISNEQRIALTRSANAVMSSTPSLSLQLASAFFPSPVFEDSKLECASCHHEHKGLHADIKSISSNRCQICHSVQFEDVPSGHPSFSEYPKVQPSRILFNHSTHMQKHFINAPGGEVAFDCLSCHSVDPSGKHMLSGTFEQTCASCHNDDTTDGDGLAVLNVPYLDKVSLDESEKPIGYWPDVDPGLVFEPFAPVLLLLLSGDDSVENWQDTLAAILAVEDLSFLESEEDEIQLAAQQLAWAVKSLYSEIQNDGHEALISRLENILNRELSIAEKSSLMGALSPETIQNSITNWFPIIEEELEAYQSGEELPESPDEPDWLDTNLDWSSVGGWVTDGEMYTVFYKPTGHEDAFMKTWIDISVELINQNNNEMAARSLTLLTNDDAPGKCLKCHHLSQNNLGQLSVQWEQVSFVHQKKQFTNFDHSPHIKSGQELSCSVCHEVNHELADAFETASLARDQTPLLSNFTSVSNKTCFECHNSQNAGDSCLQCHNYHIHSSEVKVNPHISALQ